MDIEALLRKINAQNDKWSEIYGRALPSVAIGRKKSFSAKSALLYSMLLRSALFILSLIPVSKPPKYIFQGLRHRTLIELLPAAEVMVLGGRNEFFYCIKSGYKFYWIGYISKAFQLYMGASQKEIFAKAILFLHKLFTAQSEEQKYLFLYEDSLPIGLTLSAALNDMQGLNVICIQHGIYFRYNDIFVPPEGMYCKFNLVWDSSQRKLYKGGGDPATFILGLPYEMKPSILLNRKVVLVGHSGRSSGLTEYFFSLYHFSKIFKILQDAGCDVSFRPHPQDDINFIRSVFPSVCIESKLDLFASGRMAFIGFASSLMYEARQLGNIVISLDNSIFPFEMDIDLDGIVLERDYENLPLYLSRLFDDRSPLIDINIESLSSRFHNCISQIDAFNASKGRG
ncbi:MAG: hypothetical protein A2178_00570 [Planctomycetes bacterium GWC2_49_10]|nr:MAG: hypothetical protein A2178_00570 [Planctomycetes bacterium GWC2_49_10]